MTAISDRELKQLIRKMNLAIKDKDWVAARMWASFVRVAISDEIERESK